MSEVTLKIKQVLETSIEQNQREENNKTIQELSEQLNLIQEFIFQYEKNHNIQSAKLPIIYENLNKENVKTLEEYSQLFELLNYFKQNNTNQLFNNDIKKIEILFNELLIEIKKLEVQIQEKIEEQNKIQLKITKNILKYQKLLYILEEFAKEKIISSSNFDAIYQYLKNECTYLLEEEKVELIYEMTLQNAKLMDKKIKLEQIKQNRIIKQQRRNQEQKLEQQVIEKEKSKSNQAEEVIETKEENPAQSVAFDYFTPEQKALYQQAKEILSKYNGFSEEINTFVEKRNSNDKTVKERLIWYKTISNSPEFHKSIIAKDISYHIIKNLENNSNPILKEKLFNELKILIKAFNEEHKPEQIFDYIEVLKNLNLVDQLELCNKIDELMEMISQKMKENKEFTMTISQYVKSLNQSKSDFIQSLKDYSEVQNEETIELLNLLFDELYDKYKETEKIFSYYTFSVPSNQNAMLEKAKSFYSKITSLNNIIVFVNDNDDAIPIIETDIEEDRRISSKQKKYSATLNKLRMMVSDNFVASGGQSKDDKVKSRIYNKDFLETFQVKSTHNGDTRIFYSRFRTNLKEIFPECNENTHILFIYEIGYGATDKQKKADINALALSRAYSNKERIAEICSLLMTDWNKISEKDKEERQKEIKEYLRRQTIKLGHFISKTEESNTLEEGREK
ncbi:MAG: hypothetical protein PUD25_04265 [Bacilli bacterium]|nr:hypothetical protein [Bacilli bacterium]